MYSNTAKNAIDPLDISKIIKRSIEVKKPKVRYSARNAKPFLYMRKLLPDWLFDKMLMMQLK